MIFFFVNFIVEIDLAILIGIVNVAVQLPLNITFGVRKFVVSQGGPSIYLYLRERNAATNYIQLWLRKEF